MSSLHIRSLGEATESIWALNAAQVRDITASVRATPGGGSIAVVTATLGLALVHKGACISLKRVGEDMGRRESLNCLCENIRSALASMSGFADEDSQAFQEYIAARSLPRATADERISRDAAMDAALLRATRVPLSSVRAIFKALEYADAALSLSDQHLLSDVFGGAVLMEAGAKACLLNVSANVLLQSNQEMRVTLETERAELERLCLDLSASLARTYEARMTDSKDFTGQ